MPGSARPAGSNEITSAAQIRRLGVRYSYPLLSRQAIKPGVIGPETPLDPQSRRRAVMSLLETRVAQLRRTGRSRTCDYG